MGHSAILLVLRLTLLGAPVFAQQTIFNVPSADVLDAKKVYGELDFTYSPQNPNAAFTPRVVAGIGHRLEIGLNLFSFSTPNSSTIAFVPTAKMQLWRKSGWSLFAGDDLFLPAVNSTYGIGDYTYGAVSKQFSRTRIAAGAYYFSPHVIAADHQVGAQLSAEQIISKRLTVAADWYSGKNAVGYLTPGLIWKINSKVTLYPAYEIGNSGLRSGNHLVLIEIGWNLN